MGSLLFLGLLLWLLTRKRSANGSAWITSSIEFLTDLFPIVGRAGTIVTGAVDTVAAFLDAVINVLTPILAWLWVVCLVLAVGCWVTPLEFAGLYPRTVVHCALWLFIFSAARHFGWPAAWPVRLWLTTIVVGVVSAVLALGGLPLIFYEASFFLPLNRWQTSHVYFQRRSTLLVDQKKGNIGPNTYRRVLLRPVTPLFNWVQELPYQTGSAPPQPAGAGWVTVNRPAADFSLDPAKQRQLDAAKEREKQCWANRRQEDSLAICGQLPLEARTLPAVSRQGANTVGCLAGGEVWRNYLVLVDSGRCRQAGAIGMVRRLSTKQKSVEFSLSAIMRVGNIYRYITLRLPELHGPGRYTLSNDAHETNSPEAAHLMLTSQKTVDYSTTKNDYITTTRFPGSVSITRFDTTAHIVSGTFQGSVYDVSNQAGPVTITEGRFDVRYYEQP